MIKWRWRGVEFVISVWFPIVCLYLMHADTSGITVLALTAAFVHEIGHMAALALYGDHPRKVTISAFGVRMDMCHDRVADGYEKDFVVACAGPTVNILAAAVLCTLSPIAARIHLGLGLWNLLPLYPLDGERMLCAWLSSYCCPTLRDSILRRLFWGVWIACFGVSVTLLISRFGNPSMCIITVYCGLAYLQHNYAR